MKIIEIKSSTKNAEQLLEKHSAKFETYFENLVEYNNKVNLTAITERDEVFVKHFLDSILGAEFIKENAKVIDIGAGAGFPSLPIKILQEDIDLTMLDSLNKRITFLNLLCGKLGVKSTNIHSRAEDFAIKHREEFDVTLARAVAKMNTLVEYLLPLTKFGGKAIVYKGANYLDELKEAQNAIHMLGGEVEEVCLFTLPNNMGERAIIMIKKIKHTPPQYPRGKNLPKLKPIK